MTTAPQHMFSFDPADRRDALDPDVEEKADGGSGTNFGSWFRRQTEARPADAPPAPMHIEPTFSAGDGHASAEEPRPDDFSPLDLRDRVVIMLLFKQALTVDEVAGIWRAWQRLPDDARREPLWRFLAAQDGIDRERVFQEAAEVYAYKTVRVTLEDALTVVRRERRMFRQREWLRMRSLGVFPIARHTLVDQSVKWVFGTHDPTRPEIQQFIKTLHVGTIELCYVPESLTSAIARDAFTAQSDFADRVGDEPIAYDLGTSFERERLVDEERLDAEIKNSSLINLFEATLVEAVRAGASDVHVWPNQLNRVEIHMRIDGQLSRWHVEDRVHPEALIAVIKDNATNIDRFERDRGQDGYLQRRIDNALIRFRVSVLPLAGANNDIRAESVVIRVLDDRKVITDLGALGLRDLAMQHMRRAISQPHGMIILTGPTGSGKSTTLYAALSHVVTPKVNVLSIEDPVEYVIPDVRQIKLTHKFGLEDALRSVLRHDPDVVMVGEMRDRATAELAVKLANTGHLTFSTLHTNDAPSAVGRLYKMGIEPFLLANAIHLVVSQRLIRLLCPDCRREHDDVDEAELHYLGLPRARHYFRSGDDPHCPTCGGSGYRGRRAIAETMPFSRSIRRMIMRAPDVIDEDALREAAIEEGMLTLRDAARDAVVSGETSIEELVRVVATES